MKSIGTISLIAAACLTLPAWSQNANTSNKAGATTPQIQIKYRTMQYTPADSGQQMYAAYCASCHGDTGKGNGPAALALRKAPADLTVLAAGSNGRFPSSAVRHILIDVPGYSAETSREMPVCYPALRALDRSYPSMTSLRVNNLVGYLETLQVQNQHD